ncbi:TMEM143 family protein [Rhodoplanes sp. Z2-YC6860]|uniref:TMEM143 family protein n=1 Tax=Rhodoplanes sp. Z2-YC6860 TaxID=674703 RepID=UPI00078CD242|nr:TMEM143 family protein [Rhodoplanes sp. Z2-YC6860]AMN39301.1 hypothetical protein RHPLAN_08390 [Rhodoplanes sp. Z2-YC6860]
MDQQSAQDTGGGKDREHFIPVRKIDIIEALIVHGALGAERDKFRQLCEQLAAIEHYEYHVQLARLHNDYFYFAPESTAHARAGVATLKRAYRNLIEGLTEVLHDANFIEVPREEIERAQREDSIVRLKITAPLDNYREVRFFRRGHHQETVLVSSWYGLRKRERQFKVYDDVMMIVTVKEGAPAPENGKKKRQKSKLRPGAVLLKYFHNIAGADLNALYPDVKVVMGWRDQLMLGVPALIGGVPILLKLASTVTVLFLIAGFYLGFSSSVRDEEWAGALAALSGLGALGGFAVTQWMKFQRQTLLHQKTIADNIYYRNVNNNAGVFDTLIGEAEEQESKEAFLAYYFLLEPNGISTHADLDVHIETWLKKTFGVDVDFEGHDALSELERHGILTRDGDQLTVLPLDKALERLDRAWNSFFPAIAAK